MPGFGNKNNPEVSHTSRTIWFNTTDVSVLGTCLVAQNCMGGECQLGNSNSSSVPIRKDPQRRALVAPQLPREGAGRA